MSPNQTLSSGSRSRGRGRGHTAVSTTTTTASPQPKAMPIGGSMDKIENRFDDMAVSSQSTRNVNRYDDKNSLDTSSSQPPRGPRESAFVAPKLAPAVDQAQRVEVTSNMYPLRSDEGASGYRYDVNIVKMLAQHERSCVRGARDDAAYIKRRQLCRDVLEAAIQQSGLEQQFGHYLYDGSATLFLSKEIDMRDIGILSLDAKNLSQKFIKDHVGAGGTPNFKITITPCTTSAYKVTLNDFDSSMPADVSCWDRTLRTFLEMLTSEHAARTKSHSMFGNGKLFDEHTQPFDLGEGKILRSGADKGVRIVGEKHTQVVAALVLDSKKASFFTEQNLAATVNAILGRSDQELNQVQRKMVYNQLKDLRVVLKDAPKLTYQINGLSQQPASRMIADIGGMLLDEYIRRGYEFRFPNWPAVQLDRGPKKPLLVPMEALEVCANQRVPLNKQTPAQMQAAIKQCVVMPHIRFADIQRNLQALNLAGGRNCYLEQFGVKLDRSPIKVRALIRNPPQIKYGQNKMQDVNRQRANFRSGVYVKPVTIDSWQLFCAAAQFQNQIEAFIQKLTNVCRQKCMTVAKPRIQMIRPGVQAIGEAMDQLYKEKKVKFVMLIAGRDETHDYLKLMEARYQIVTQHVTDKVASKVVIDPKPFTAENIVAKMNMKNYGTNYNVVPEGYCRSRWLAGGETLVIGYDVAHPPPQKKMRVTDGGMAAPMDPSVIGFSYNGAKEPETFIGDYHFQESRKESVTCEVLRSRMKWMLEGFQKNRGKLPKYVIIMRDGVSEGQFEMVIRDELGAIREACEEFTAGYKPKFALINANKRHNKRFFVGDGHGGYANPPPGMVVDSGVTMPNVSEFFMQSHYPIQGTAKPTEYHLLVDELAMGMDEVQALVNGLCYEHQIVTSAISIPEPIYQADEWSKRGQANFVAFRIYHEDVLQTMLKADGSYDFDLLTKRMAYRGRQLEMTRANA